MAVAIVSSSALTTVAAGGTATINVAVPNQNLYAVALLGGGNFNHQVPKYNGSGGTDMSLLVGKDALQSEAYIYGYKNPATGTIPFYFSNTGASQAYYCQVLLLSGVDMGTPSAGTNTLDVTGTDINFTVTHAYKAGQLALMLAGTSTSITTWTAITCTKIANNNYYWSGYRTADPSGSTQLRTTTSTSARFAAVGIVFNPAMPAAQVIWWM